MKLLQLHKAMSLAEEYMTNEFISKGITDFKQRVIVNFDKQPQIKVIDSGLPINYEVGYVFEVSFKEGKPYAKYLNNKINGRTAGFYLTDSTISYIDELSEKFGISKSKVIEKLVLEMKENNYV